MNNSVAFQHVVIERKVIDYVLLGDKVSGDLRERVLDLLRKGWELYGPPYVYVPVTGADKHVQAMILRESTEGDKS